jgi:hypothetical protein
MALSQTTAMESLQNPSMEFDPKIWVLGGKSRNADRSIAWDAPFPNFADPDILIINLNTLDDQTIQAIDKSKFQKAMLDITDKFMYGNGTIIVIASPHSNEKGHPNRVLSPVSFRTVAVQEGHNIKIDSGHPFTRYLNRVKSFDFYLENFDVAPEIPSKLKRDKTEAKLEVLSNNLATDNAGHVLSIGYKVSINNATKVHESGQVFILPPCRDLPGDEAIDSIIENLKRSEVKESPPTWVATIPIEGLDVVAANVKQLMARKAAVDARLAVEEKRRLELTDHTRLLFASGAELEDAVFKAFKQLGFDEIERIREKNKEDWVFKFQTLSRYEYGIIEVKGAEERIAHAHLTQCSKWSDEYFEKNAKASKAILITNQYRLQDYKASIDKRKYFDFNELEYARMKDIVVLPSYALFEIVSDSLKDIKKSRASLEEKLAYGSGLIERL